MTDVLTWHGWSDLTLVAACVALIGTVTFVARYVTVSHGAWHDTSEGRWMVYGRIILAALLSLVIVNRVWPDWSARRVVTFLLMTLFAVQAYWPIVLVNRAQREREKIK